MWRQPVALCSAILATMLLAACTQREESPTASPAARPTTEPTTTSAPLPNTTFTPQPQQGVESLIQSLGQRDADARVQAIDRLEQMGSDAREAVPALLELLASDDDSGVRSATASAVGLIGSQVPEVFPALSGAALRDRDAVVRAMAQLAFLDALDRRRQDEQSAAGPAYVEVDVWGQGPEGPLSFNAPTG